MTAQQAFLMVQAGLVTVLVLTAAVVWRRSQPVEPPAVGRLDEVELAAINGGPQLAVITAATALRRSHVAQTPEGTLVANGPLVDDACELERELFEVVRETPDRPASALVAGAAESDTVKRLMARLEAMGLRLGDDAQRKLLVVGWCAGALAFMGLLGLAGFLAAGARDGAALGAGAALTVVTLVAKHWAGRRRRGPTVAGRRLLKSVRTERANELRAAGGQLSLGVAMFGGAALWSTDPAFAGALGIPAQTETAFAWNAAAFGAGWEAGCGCGCGGCG